MDIWLVYLLAGVCILDLRKKCIAKCRVNEGNIGFRVV